MKERLNPEFAQRDLIIVENGGIYNNVPNATTVNNTHNHYYNYGNTPNAHITSQNSQGAEDSKIVDREKNNALKKDLKKDILEYVDKISPFVADKWEKKYTQLWREILNINEVEAEVFNPGRQHNTKFNRNLIGNIIRLLCNKEVIVKTNNKQLAITLEGGDGGSLRGQIGDTPSNKIIKEKINKLIDNMNNNPK